MTREPADFLPLSLDKARWIEDWVVSTTAASTTAAAVTVGPSQVQAGPTKHPRPAKRLCLHKPFQAAFARPFNTLHTPPPTSASDTRPDMSSDFLGKRPADDSDPTPKPPSRTAKSFPSIPFDIPSPSKRRRRPSPTKKDYLGTLEKPYRVLALNGTDNRIHLLPPDARKLYDALLPARHQEDIVPSEVRDQVVSLVGDEARRYHFREPATSGPEADATVLHANIHKILLKATAAHESDFHECAWNNLVHTPIFELVYSAVKPYQPRGEVPSQQSRPASARIVPAMAATILRRYVPQPLSTYPSEAASATSSASASRAGDSVSSTPYSDTSFHTSMPAQGDSKKVDYLLAIDVTKGSPLSVVFERFIARESARERDWDGGVDTSHVNQTLYPAVQWSPVFCSVETKLREADSVVQLGIWLGAWHKRMERARQHVHTVRPDLRRPEDATVPRACIPSALLMKIVEHDWSIYFACDTQDTNATGEMFDTITLFGPLTIGSTRDLLGIYQLVATLKVIKDWGETTFQERLEEWFLCDRVLPG